jgi:hypothetical protein
MGSSLGSPASGLLPTPAYIGHPPETTLKTLPGFPGQAPGRASKVIWEGCTQASPGLFPAMTNSSELMYQQPLQVELQKDLFWSLSFYICVYFPKTVKQVSYQFETNEYVIECLHNEVLSTVFATGHHC